MCSPKVATNFLGVKKAHLTLPSYLICILQVAKELSEKLPNVRLHVFSDRDLEPRRSQIEKALAEADIFFGSLLFDYDQVEWLKSKVDKIPVSLVFESALELMSTTQIGTFQVCRIQAVK